MLEETAALNYLLPLAGRFLDSLQNYQGFPNQVPNPPPVTDLEFVERNTFHWGPRQAPALPLDLTTSPTLTTYKDGCSIGCYGTRLTTTSARR